jgi:hypothetical protein
MDRFVTILGINWMMTDTNGWPLNSQEFRDLRISELMDKEKDCKYDYNIYLSGKNLDQYMISFQPHNQIIKLWTLSSENVLRITLKCSTFEKAKSLINDICLGNDLEIAPVNIKPMKSSCSSWYN